MAKTILLADDSMTIQKVVELTFMDQDYQVVAVSDGESAIQRLAEVNPDLVIADVHMPGASGYDVCRHTKAERPGTPVLLLVGTFEQFDEEAARAAGADGDLKKPFDSQELLGQVERLLASSSPAPAAVSAEPELSFGSPGLVDDLSLVTQDIAPPLSPAPDFAAPTSDFAAPTPDFGAASSVLSSTAPSVEFAAPAAPAVQDFSAPAVEIVPNFGMAPPAAEAEPETAYASELATTPQVDPPTATPETVSTQLISATLPDLTDAAPEPVAAAPAAEPEVAPELSIDPLVDGNAVTRPMPSRQVAVVEETPSAGLSDDDVDRIARRVVELLADAKIQDVAWEVVPDLAEVIIKERIQELESQVESA